MSSIECVLYRASRGVVRSMPIAAGAGVRRRQYAYTHLGYVEEDSYKVCLRGVRTDMAYRICGGGFISDTSY